MHTIRCLSIGCNAPFLPMQSDNYDLLTGPGLDEFPKPMCRLKVCRLGVSPQCVALSLRPLNSNVLEMNVVDRRHAVSGPVPVVDSIVRLRLHPLLGLELSVEKFDLNRDAVATARFGHVGYLPYIERIKLLHSSGPLYVVNVRAATVKLYSVVYLTNLDPNATFRLPRALKN